ncbi:MAG: restriction endonuclease subunit S [Kiritimatiellae bacterium]|nr:restriction endonuclease subunit S [Kiritimatiellia bacterium]
MARLDKICSLNMGQSPDSSSYNENGNGMPFFQGNADFGKIHPRVRVWCSAPTKIAHTGDVLISVRAPIGALNIADRECCIGRGLAALTVNEELCNKDYLWYAITSKVDELNSKGTGSTFKAISKNVLAETEIPLPDLNEQKIVAKRLSKIDELIAMRKEQLTKLDQLVKSRFIELFGDSVTNSMGWVTDTVIGVCDDIYGGGTPSKSHPEYYENGDIPWVSSKDMKTDVLYDSQIKINQLGVDNSTAKMVPINSVIMVIRSGILKHTLPVAVNAVPITVNQDLKVFIPSNRILSIFLMHQFKMLEKDILSGVRAVTADNIEFDSLKKREIIVPPMELQERFAAFVKQTDKSKLVIQQSLNKLELLNKSLMQEYFG